MNKYRNLLFALSFAVVFFSALVIGVVIGMKYHYQAARVPVVNAVQNAVTPAGEKLNTFVAALRTMYVDTLNVDSLVDDAIVDILAKLDPHSSYIPASDLEEVNSQISGNFYGVGIQFSIQQDTVNVVAIIPGGPSEMTGIKPGDRIVNVDDSLFVGKTITNERVLHSLRGENGTKVRLDIKRNGVDTLLHYTITRGKVEVKSVDASLMVSEDVGYLRINQFGATTYNEFVSALARLRDQGAGKFIVDLRDNPGGLLDAVIAMLNELLGRGQMIVYAEGSNYLRSDAVADGMGSFQKYPVVVLVNEFSASASEIFAGAVQDNDRGLIIGRRTFGKGLVQQQMDFNDKSAMRITVARYYMPSGRCIQKHYKLGQQTDYYLDIYDRYNRGELYNKDSTLKADTTKYYTTHGRVVYGGGGVMPDIFVPRDTSYYSAYYNKVFNLALPYQFAYQYVDAHREQLKNYQTWQQAESALKSDKVVEKFVANVKQKHGFAPTAADKKCMAELQRWLISYIIRDARGDKDFFSIITRDDKTVKLAIEKLSDLGVVVK
ncbi:MAG TPA: peptidase S41 [Bacteroidales bacterium]|nr:peptidase S41 [Bacteroidales bacterium]